MFHGHIGHNVIVASKDRVVAVSRPLEVSASNRLACSMLQSTRNGQDICFLDERDDHSNHVQFPGRASDGVQPNRTAPGGLSKALSPNGVNTGFDEGG